MAALKAGTAAPEVVLPLLGGGEFRLSDVRKSGPVLLAFFKISCPVCQMALPYIERIFQGTHGKGLAIVGVSQDSAANSAAFAEKFGITFPIALDDTERYPVSNAYGLTNVPTLFLVNEAGKIELTSVGWSRADVQHVTGVAAARHQGAKLVVFLPGEQVPDFKGG
ncbi:MAG TPA: TlpA disulfide reductase family protein [Terriglobales bacterium]|nr:TlpA disulfide reductase family protein [Terriglobales bacterium]